MIALQGQSFFATTGASTPEKPVPSRDTDPGFLNLGGICIWGRMIFCAGVGVGGGVLPYALWEVKQHLH